MRKIYLYTIILITFLAAGLALAERANVLFVEQQFGSEETILEEEGQEAFVNNCPTVTLKVDKNYTSCKNPNGKITATVTGGSGSYSIKWYKQVGFPDSEVGTGLTIDKMEAGFYIAIVKDNNRPNCEINVSAQILNQTPKIVQHTKILNNVIGCDGAEHGRLEIVIEDEDGSQNITTIWMEGPVVDYSKEIPKWKNMLVAYQLPKGTFTVISRNNNTGCYSDPFTITIGQVTPPAVNETITPNTSCVSGNGTINITAYTPAPGMMAAGGYSFIWYQGQQGNLGATIGGATNTSTTSSISGLAPGFYTVQVNNVPNDGNCVSYYSFEVPDNANYPSLSLSSTPNTVCALTTSNDGYTGSMTATVRNETGAIVSDYSNYRLNWFDASGNPLPANTSGSVNIYNKLKEGNYQVSVTNTSTSCTSGVVPVTVGYTPPSLTINLTAKAQTNCSGTNNGGITAQIIKGGNDVTANYSSYSLAWFQGTTTAGTAITTNITNNTASALAGGQDYTVMVTDNASGCTAIATVNVPLEKTLPALTLTPSFNPVLLVVSVPAGSFQV